MSGDHRGVAGSAPYPWPWDGALDPARLALLVVSCRHHGQGQARADRIGPLAGLVHRTGGLVVRVRVGPVGPLDDTAAAENTGTRGPHGSSGSHGTFGMDGSFGMDGVDGVDGVDGMAEAAVAGPGWDGFHGTGLDLLLRRAGRDTLLLAGCCLETGVHSTMRAANDRGHECLVVADACVPADPGLRDAALSMIQMSGGIFGAVGEAAAVAAALGGEL